MAGAMAVISLLIAGYSYMSAGQRGTPTRAVEVKPKLFATAEVDKYSSLEELVREAQLVVKADVLMGGNSKGHDEYKGLLYRLTRVRVSEVLKGEPNKGGSELTVLEFVGGEHDGESYGFEGTPLLKPGESYLLFLGVYSGPLGEGVYVVPGVWQGRARINKTTTEYLGSPNDHELRAVLNGRRVEDLVSEIRRIN